MTISEMIQKRAKVWETAKNFVDTHENENGVLSAEDNETYSRMEKEIEDLTNAIDRQQRAEAREAELNKPVNTPITERPTKQTEDVKTGRASNAYKEDFGAHLRGKRLVHNVLSEGVQADGGYLVPEEFERQIVTGLDEANVVRSLAKVITTNAERKIPVAATHSTAAWTAENGAYTESNPTFDQKTIDAFKLTDLVKVSIELLQDSMFDLESYIADEFARAFGIAEEEAFCVGTGTNQPTGMSKVAAVSGATGSDLEALRDKAREMGSKTKFSASEAAEAMNYMAMAGWKTEDTMITDFDQVKDNIVCRLANAEMNEEYLANKPHTFVEDLAVVYVIDLGGNEAGHMSAPITNTLMEQYGITTEELHDIALHNLSESQIEFKTMRDVLVDMMFPDGIKEDDPRAFMVPPEEENPSMYVLTNAERLNGAAAILDAKTMEDISEKLGGDFIILPSSIHETLILPVNEDMSRQMLESMVQDVNAGQVAPEERLSDHVYMYDSQEKELVLADKMEERQQQRAEAQRDEKGIEQGDKPGKSERGEKKPERERISMKEKLPEKKAEVAKNEANREHPVPSKTKETALA